MIVLGLVKVLGKRVKYGRAFYCLVYVRETNFLSQSYFGCVIQSNCSIFYL